MIPIRYYLKRIELFFVYRVLHVNDTPHRIALSVAIGIFVAWTPTVGFQMILTILLAALFRANKLVGVPFVWISNPVTLVPIYRYCNYAVGRALLRGEHLPPDFSKVAVVPHSWSLDCWLTSIRTFWEATWHAMCPLWLGSIVVGLTLAAISYGIVRYAVVTYRKRRHARYPNRRKLPL